jgi:uncharacterized SAM-binding protein YcdF (DUF218 family)
VIPLIKATGGPGSIPFLLVAVALGLFVIYVWPRRRRLGQAWIAILCAAYLLLAVPVTAHKIADALPGGPNPRAEITQPLAHLIILDGDNRRGRVRRAQEILASARPPHVWVLGDEWILDALAEAGVSPEFYRLEGGAGNTLEQMHQVARIASELPSGQLAGVITSRLQAARAAGVAGALSIPVTVIAAPVDVEPPRTGAWRFLPTYAALRVSRDALYEHAALWWYARQGWIRSPQPADR